MRLTFSSYNFFEQDLTNKLSQTLYSNMIDTPWIKRAVSGLDTKWDNGDEWVSAKEKQLSAWAEKTGKCSCYGVHCVFSKCSCYGVHYVFSFVFRTCKTFPCTSTNYESQRTHELTRTLTLHR
jgi:hypothetical protein